MACCPRTRGDGGTPTAAEEALRMLPPHARGWPRDSVIRRSRSFGCLARAGVARLPSCATSIPAGFPRERGEDSFPQLPTAPHSRALNAALGIGEHAEPKTGTVEVVAFRPDVDPDEPGRRGETVETGRRIIIQTENDL